MLSRPSRLCSILLGFSTGISSLAIAAPDPSSAEYRESWYVARDQALPVWQAGITGLEAAWEGTPVAGSRPDLFG